MLLLLRLTDTFSGHTLFSLYACVRAYVRALTSQQMAGNGG
jgi:hypothetical protein